MTVELVVDNTCAETGQPLSTEELFREVNERIIRLSHVFRSPLAEFLCECANGACAERMRLTLDEYEEIRCDPRRFLMVCGHEPPGVRVVEQRDGYEIVETPHVRPRPELSLVLH